jgi:hypothetical protein
MQANCEKAMFNMRRLPRFIEFNFSNQHKIHLNSRTLRSLRVLLHKPSLKEEEEGTEGI